MNVSNLKLIVICFVTVFLLAYTIPHVSAVSNQEQTNAYEYILSMFSAELGLVANSEDTGINPVDGVDHRHTYWIASDNDLAWAALAPYNKQVAQKIERTVNDYYDIHGHSMLYEVTHGETIPIGIHPSTNLLLEDVTVNSEPAQILLDSHREEHNSAVYHDAFDYTDLALYTALNYWIRGDVANAKLWFGYVEALWNGIGFEDRPARMNLRFDLFKFGLFVFVQRVTQFESNIVHEVEYGIWQHQNDFGGIVTLMTAEGDSIGTANMETTAMCLLAYNTDLVQTVRNREVYQLPTEQPGYMNPLFVLAILAILFIGVIVKRRG